MSADPPASATPNPMPHEIHDRRGRPALLELSASYAPAEERRRVLVVDDEPGMRYTARRILEKKFIVREAGSGEEALKILESEAFHIAVVDVRLPGLSGLDLLSALKGLSPACDVIVMTGSAVDVDEVLEGAIRRKAFFFLRKPFPMTVLETLVERVAETQELEERLIDYARTLERNLESARIFQRQMLPPSTWTRAGIRIASHYVPSERLSGDFFDYWELPTGGTALVIVDVMGHGPSSAMITGIVKSQLHSLAAELHDPGTVLTALEQELSRINLRAFLTALLLFDRPEEGTISYCGAGHPSGVLRRETTGAADRELLSSAGVPINTGLPIIHRETVVLTRSAGSRVLLYTDGYSEARSRVGTFFDSGPDSAFPRSAQRALLAGSPEDGIRILESACTEFTGPTPPEDDRAAVLAWMI
jgi:sigma-B regulation protein RsbU (phosphoserine phosphatase)